MIFDLSQIDKLADGMIKIAPREKLLDGLKVITSILEKIQKRLEELDNGKTKIR